MNQQELPSSIPGKDGVLKITDSDFSFLDLIGHKIDLSFNDRKFSDYPDDVLVFAFYQNYLVMTKHKTRGLELPGGKIHLGEYPLQAVFRETWEETGGILNSIQQIGEYIIRDYKGKDRIKSIYYGRITRFSNLPDGFETNGFELLSLPVNAQKDGFSPLVRDYVFTLTLEYLKSIKFGFYGDNRDVRL
ncbi:NUDIX domain-containing protein [Cylindrospermopsis raciborskii]|uniref:NUDIX domain-containing protein n=1 Tax=Cylindrospermopsis raciborskii TaxID=77022 RepID=UPI0009A3ABE2|nr:NUDIX domain-containing protein [Cylindrospermopsis raciborskii]MCZ2207332.1 NUDIX domain-containing protein [Cylindrospermopsis raciborskii PAMP2011]NLQ03571.1 NUDIX domain-containing protein [Cylindrospermopsis raciborskii MVCC19]